MEKEICTQHIMKMDTYENEGGYRNKNIFRNSRTTIRRIQGFCITSHVYCFH